MKIKNYLKIIMFFNGTRNKIKEINNNKCDYEKDYLKIKFISDDTYH